MNFSKSEELIFCEALDLPEGQRAAFLQEACGDDPELIKAVEGLLQLHDTEANFLATPAIGISSIAAEENPGDLVAAFKLENKIGEGGFGVVWKAQQLEPIKRLVALKIVKLGMDSQSIIERFDDERQTLALMNHPNIATVLDAGVTKTGRPFFAMELVEGDSIERYTRDHQLSLVDQLRLFVTVCRAIQHAHQKGIVHLDLKPSNILIASNGDQCVPKVIDFGIATAVQNDTATDSKTRSNVGLMGTPQYMSPEQWNREADVDTRSDIYSLGVVLYVLLAGTLPGNENQDGPTTLPQLPRRLSKDSGLQYDPSGDLNWIIGKATCTQRDARYQSASEMAIDVERYLEGRPVVANPGGSGYVLKKFITRNKVAFGSGVLTLLALITGVCASTLGMVYANEQRAIADKQKVVAQDNEKEAIRLKEIAEAEARKLRVVANVLKNILPEAKPFRGIKSGFQIREHLDELINAVDTLSSEPELEAELRVTAARVYENLSRYGRARLQYSKAREIRDEVLGVDHPKSLLCLAGMAACNIELGRLQAAERMINEVLEKSEGKAPRNHIHALRTLRKIRDEQGRLDEAFEVAQQCVELANTMFANEIFLQIHVANEYSVSAMKIGLHEEAESVVRDSLNVLQRDHPERQFVIANTNHRLAEVLLGSGKFAEAKKYASEFVEIQKATLGENDQYVIRGLSLLSEIYRRDEDFSAAESIALDAVERAQSLQSDQLKIRRTAYRQLAITLEEIDLERASQAWEKTIEFGWQFLGGDPRVGGDLLRQAKVFEALADFKTAANRIKRAIDILEHRSDGKSKLPRSYKFYAQILERLNQPELAKEYLEKAGMVDSNIERND